MYNGSEILSSFAPKIGELIQNSLKKGKFSSSFQKQNQGVDKKPMSKLTL